MHHSVSGKCYKPAISFCCQWVLLKIHVHFADSTSVVVLIMNAKLLLVMEYFVKILFRSLNIYPQQQTKNPQLYKVTKTKTIK